MAITKIVELQVNSNLDATTQDVKQLDNAVKSVEKSAGKMGEEITKSGKAGTAIGNVKNMVTELNPALAGAEKGFGAVLKQMWAMVANPIGAVIAALVLGLTALYKAFTSTDEGADKLEQIMSGLSNVMVVIRDRFLKFGEALAKFFSGDFSGAVKDAKSAISGVGDEITKEFKKGAEAAKLLQEVGDAMRDLKVARAELNRNLAESKELLSDENATYAEKKKAIEEIRKGEAEYTKAALDNAKKSLLAAQLSKKMSADERLDAIANAKAEIANLEAESSQILRSANKQQKQLNNEMEADQKEAHDKRIARAKELKELADKQAKELAEARKKEIEDLNAFQIAVNNAEFAQRQANIDDVQRQSDEIARIEAQKTANEEAEAKKRIENAKIESEAKLAIQNATLDNISKGVNLLQSLGIKNKAIQKGLIIAENAAGIAKTIINTMAANAKAIAASPLTAGQPFVTANTISGAIGVATSIAATAKALSALGGGGSAGGGSTIPNAGGAGGSTPPQFSVVGNSGVNQLAGVLSNREQTPVKAYVVPSDVSTGQSLDRNVIKNASLG